MTYTVRFGTQHIDSARFAEFVDALLFYRAHRKDTRERATLEGYGADGEHDGLTEDERMEVIG